MNNFIFQLKELPLFFKNPKRYAARRTMRVRLFFHRLFILLQFPKFLKYLLLAKDFTLMSNFPKIPEDKGFLKIEYLPKNLVNSVVQEAKDIVFQTDLNELENKTTVPHLITVPILDRIKPGCSFLKFALNYDLIRVIANYFGILPVLKDIVFLYSPNRVDIETSSQHYHLDGQDVKFVQVFLFVEDVDQDNGPFTFINARDSAQIAGVLQYRKIEGYRRVVDEKIYSSMNHSIVPHQLVGKAGSCFLVDVDRCFHFGSRQGNKRRLLLSFQYCTPFAFVLPWNHTKGLPFASLAKVSKGFSPHEKYILGAL